MQYPALVEETTTTTGTGDITLAGAIELRRPFSVAGNGAYVPYIIEASDGGWESGIGQVTVGTPNLLTRLVVLSSSNADTALNLPTGTHKVRCSDPGPIEALDRGGIIGLGTSHAMASGYESSVPFDTEQKDTDACWDIGTPTDLKAPIWAGHVQYAFTCELQAPSMPVGAIVIDLAPQWVTPAFSYRITPHFQDDGFGTIVAHVNIVTPPLQITAGQQSFANVQAVNQSNVTITMMAGGTRFEAIALA